MATILSLRDGIALLFFTLLALSVHADQPALPRIPHKAAIRLIWWSGETPTNLEDLHLQDLEEAEGILRWDWGMEIPPGRKLIVRLHGGDSGSNPPQLQDEAFEITGPLAASFGNRISLVRRLLEQNPIEQLSLQISTQHVGDSALGGSISSTLQSVVDPLWTGERGSSGSTDIPSTIWEQHLGPASAPHRLSYQLDVSLVPAVPTDLPGRIVSLPK